MYYFFHKRLCIIVVCRIQGKNIHIAALGPAPSSRGTLYQGYLHRLRALRGTCHDGSRIGIDGKGRTDGTRRAGTGTRRRELLGKRGGPEQVWIGTSVAARPAAWEDDTNEQSTLVG